MTAQIVGATTEHPAVTLTSPTTGVGVIRATGNNQLQYTTWSAGLWTPFIAVAPQITTRARPTITSLNGAAHVVYHGEDYKHYHGIFKNGAWNPMDAPVFSQSTGHSFGPNPAAAVAVPGDNEVLIAFPGDNGDIYVQSYKGNAWGTAIGFMQAGVNLTPAVSALGPAPSAVVVFVSGSQIHYMLRVATDTWTSPSTLTGALTDTPPALVEIPGTSAALAFRGQDSKIYTATFDYNTLVWTVPAAFESYATMFSPALAAGVEGADAELAFVDAATGKVLHARLANGAWGMAGEVGNATTGPALASAP